jgi:hypothetical protein
MPLWLSLFISDGRAHGEAAEETFVITIVALVPLVLLGVIDQLHGAELGMVAALWTAISAGQLYLYSFALLGHIFWLCWKDHENMKRFPPRKYFALISFAIATLIIAVYTADPTLSKALTRPLIIASIISFIVYTVLYYILSVFDKLEPPSIERTVEREADEMASRLPREVPGAQTP